MTREYHISQLSFLKIFRYFHIFFDMKIIFEHILGVMDLQNQKSSKSVSETSPIHLDSHDKVVELAEISRLVCRKWGGRCQSF